MISIIICSRDKNVLALASQNVADTIGLPYEIIAIDNSQGQYGICAAYNKGASQSKYDILCFMHEDLQFNTNNWGQLVAEILKDNSIGALGVAGGKWNIKAPISWWGCGNKYVSINIDENDKKGYNKVTYSNPEQSKLVDVAGLDGLWICSKKDVWQKYPFDAVTFTDFHFYDIDYCANIFNEYRICVTYDINIRHFSRGNINDSWFINADKFYNKHKQRLPMGNILSGPNYLRSREYNVCKDFVLEIVKRNIDPHIGFKYLFNCFQIFPFNRNTFWLIRNYIKYYLNFKQQ
ncbi:glycosyltransferase [Hymenobacter nivis]|uniref:Glycosyltransferase n=1 Tax=Hymenobacter nivis TaxID=1850093 RepID=A0A502HGF6_9BACT|nr:glycosyltransferase [Hymenobacter nivis]TPG72260.1 glycosyltransferase [Hymenobacter nivis]